MAKLKSPPSLVSPPSRYDEWLEFFFGRTDRDAADKWALDWTFDASPSDIADLFAHTMMMCGRDLKRFSDAQVAVGLESLFFAENSNIPHELAGDGVSEAQRVAALRSIKFVYSDCLEQRSAPVLGHLNETTENRLWYFTYMLWDVTFFDAMALKTNERIDALFEVFEAGLQSSNIACVESALHGLGHLSGKGRNRAQSSIDAWLARNASVRPELITYAKAARTGMIQ